MPWDESRAHRYVMCRGWQPGDGEGVNLDGSVRSILATGRWSTCLVSTRTRYSGCPISRLAGQESPGRFRRSRASQLNVRWAADLCRVWGGRLSRSGQSRTAEAALDGAGPHCSSRLAGTCAGAVSAPFGLRAGLQGSCGYPPDINSPLPRRRSPPQAPAAQPETHPRLPPAIVWS